MLLNEIPGGGRWEGPPPGAASNAVTASARLPAMVGQLTLVLHISVGLVSVSIALLLFDGTLFAWVRNIRAGDLMSEG